MLRYYVPELCHGMDNSRIDELIALRKIDFDTVGGVVVIWRAVLPPDMWEHDFELTGYGSKSDERQDEKEASRPLSRGDEIKMRVEWRKYLMKLFSAAVIHPAHRINDLVDNHDIANTLYLKILQTATGRKKKRM